MKERNREMLNKGVNVAILGIAAYFISNLALTRKQRESILVRDENKCQAPYPHRCNGQEKLEVHHILPQSYLKRMGLGNNNDLIDEPFNLITLCGNAHEYIHPDKRDAMRHYYEDKKNGKNSFELMRDGRNSLLDQRKIYWMEQWDRAFQILARMNEKRHKGWEFPYRDKK